MGFVRRRINSAAGVHSPMKNDLRSICENLRRNLLTLMNADRLWSLLPRMPAWSADRHGWVLYVEEWILRLGFILSLRDGFNRWKMICVLSAKICVGICWCGYALIGYDYVLPRMPGCCF